MLLDSDSEHDQEEDTKVQDEQEKQARLQKRLGRVKERRLRQQELDLKEIEDQEKERKSEIEAMNGTLDTKEACLRMDCVFSSGIPSRIDVFYLYSPKLSPYEACFSSRC